MVVTDMARRFRFPLQTLLRVRELYEREAKRKVAAQSAEIARVGQLIEQTAAEVIRQQDVLRQRQRDAALDPLDLQRGRAWIAHLRRTIAGLHTQRATLQERLRQLQGEFREARKQRRVIDKLRERRWAEYARDRKQKEQAAADELARQLPAQEMD